MKDGSLSLPQACLACSWPPPSRSCQSAPDANTILYRAQAFCRTLALRDPRRTLPAIFSAVRPKHTNTTRAATTGVALRAVQGSCSAAAATVLSALSDVQAAVKLSVQRTSRIVSEDGLRLRLGVSGRSAACRLTSPTTRRGSQPATLNQGYSTTGILVSGPCRVYARVMSLASTSAWARPDWLLSV